MSFGKNDGHLGRIGGYGAGSAPSTMQQQMGNAARRQSGPRKGSPAWANNYAPSEGTPDHIRLIPGDFQAERVDKNSGTIFTESVPWFEYTEHYHGTMKKSSTCSGGVLRMSDWKKAKPCRGCDIWREDANERKRIESEKGVKPQGPNRISFSSKYAFLVLDMGWYFKGYRLDDHGRPRVSQQGGQPYMDWMRYDLNPGPYNYTAQAMQQQGKAVEVQQGMVKTWPVGYAQFNTLIGFADMIHKHCRNCGGQNCIHTSHYVCPHCNGPTLQPHETSLPPDKIKELVNGVNLCNHCRQQGYPKAIQQCGYCSHPTPANLYDVDLQIQTIKVNKTSQLHLAGTSAPKPIDPVFAEVLKKMPDMNAKFAPTPMEEQIAIFGPAPMQMQPPQQQPYGDPGYQPPQQQFGQQHPGYAGYQHPNTPAYGNQAPQQQPQTPYYPPPPGWGYPPQG